MVINSKTLKYDILNPLFVDRQYRSLNMMNKLNKTCKSISDMW